MKSFSPYITHSILKGMMYVLIFAIGFPLIYLATALSLDALLGNPLQSYNQAALSLGILFITTGFVIILSTTYELINKGGGLPLSSSPPTKLVTSGPFQWSRHPVYTGTIILMAGLYLWLNSFWGLFLGLPMLGFFYFSYARGIEEPLLQQRYGKRYLQYRKKVPLVATYPFRKIAQHTQIYLLRKISDAINRPKIIRHGNHLFFWGYGIWPGIGVAIGLGIMEFLLLSQWVPGSITAGLIIALTIFCLLGVRYTWRIITTIRLRLNFENTSTQVGFMSWGVLVIMTITCVLFGAFTSYPPIYLLDAALPGILMAHFWGRIGCLFYGCCYGKESHNHRGLHYSHRVHKVIRTEKIKHKNVIPVQILSALYGLIGSFFILVLLFYLTLPVGVPTVFAALWYGSFRINEEWLREQSVVWIDFISPAQLVSFMLIMAGITGLIFFIPETQQFYPALINHENLSMVWEDIHIFLLLGSGLVTTLLFSYHYKEIGQWR